MWLILAFIGASFLLIGILQWAQSGAGLWRIMKIKREEKFLLDDDRREEDEAEVRRLEEATDRSLRTSFRILGALALILWLFLGASVILDLLGIDWASALSGRARVYWSASPGAGGRSQSTPQRDNILRNMGQNLRR